MAHCVSQVFGLLELAFFTFGPAFAFALYFLINLAFIGKRVSQQASTRIHASDSTLYIYFIKLMHCSLSLSLGLTTGWGWLATFRQESDSCAHSHLAELARLFIFCFWGACQAHVESTIFINCN